MKILIISKECAGIALANKLVRQGNRVKIFVQEKGYDEVGNGFGIEKTKDWQAELQWVGRDGLIIFDYSGFGGLQDSLRKQGYSIVGGCEDGDRLELDRDYAHQVFSDYGLRTVPLHIFPDADTAINFLEKDSTEWVLKGNGHADKTFTYVSKTPDSSDVIDLLRIIRHGMRLSTIVLQRKISGVEIAVARFFNGIDWTGPIEIAIEHKKLFPGDLGPKTSEMGTLIWLDGNENNKLFQGTIQKMRPFLRSIGFKGKFDINCIVNEDYIFPLEATPRFGYPALEMDNVLFESSMADFLKAVADGVHHDLKWLDMVGIVVQIAVPPFPYECKDNKYNSKGLKVYFLNQLSENEWEHIHFGEVQKKGEEYILAASNGYALCVTGVGKTAFEARKNAYRLTDKVVIPKMFYRNDIGLKFIEKDKDLLHKWGYL
ncbi:MAG: phosphoribosylglycinamide synthetase C domain-containing protein [Deltaproteobacteria bacterium]